MAHARRSGGFLTNLLMMAVIVIVIYNMMPTGMKNHAASLGDAFSNGGIGGVAEEVKQGPVGQGLGNGLRSGIQSAARFLGDGLRNVAP